MVLEPTGRKPDEEKEEVAEGDEAAEEVVEGEEGEAVEGAEGAEVEDEIPEGAPVAVVPVPVIPEGAMPAGEGRGPRGREGRALGRPSEEGYVRVRLPDHKKAELFGIADQLQGGSRLKVNCEDGKSRMARIPGKLKRRMWIREGDLVIIRPWDFQNEKCDVVFRYTKTQASYLSRRGMIPKQIDIF
jgi:translation initiation factor 1A